MDTEPKPETTPEENAPTEEEEFQRRLKDDQSAETERDKELRYQLFKLEHQYGLPEGSVAKWKNDHPLGIELLWVVRKPVIYRNLSLGEYTEIAESCGDLPELRRKVARRVILWPNTWQAESDFLRSHAGIPQTITESCLRTSGFDEALALPI